MGGQAEYEQRLVEYEKQVFDLQAQAKSLEEEIIVLRRRLQDAPRRVRSLEERLLETKGQLAQALAQNDKLSATLREAREQLANLRDEIEKLTSPPNSFGTLLQRNDDGTADVWTSGRKLRVNLDPTIEGEELTRGQELILNEAFNIVAIRGFENQGEVAVVKEMLEDGRVLVLGRTDEERVVEIAHSLRNIKIRAGDHVLMDPKTGLLLEKLPRPEVEELVLEEIPDVTYADVGGLAGQIEAIHDAVELPYMHADLFRRYDLKAPKGILLYGPPGCGKTLIAKAVAHSLAERVAEKTGSADTRSYFLNVKGPELLNKYVGETERQIRMIFQRAREKAFEGVPVIVFFDEMDSLFRTRGSGISSDMEATIVPQLLAEIDGVESLENVLVIGASNREDLIDPAILRPGRLDVKIKIERPDHDAASDIFSKYFIPTLPIDEDEVRAASGDRPQAIQSMIQRAVDHMYSTAAENRFLEVTYAGGDKEELYFKDFSSGAMIENIVSRAKKDAIKRVIDGGPGGITIEDLTRAVRQEFKEHEDLPNTTNPDDWARISGKKGERIVFVRTLMSEDGKPSRAVETVTTGQYL